MIKKVHESLGHPSVGKMIKLIRRTKMGKQLTRSDLETKVKEVVDICEPCERVANQVPRRKNATIRSENFHQVVAMDLTEWWDSNRDEKVIICHFIDEFSRLSSGGIIKTKEPQAVIQCLLRDWISKYGVPKAILHDNGGEFVNEKLLTFLDRLNIRSMTTAAYSPFCNGVIERHNGVLKRKMTKLGIDSETSDMTANTKLCYALMSKNSILDRYGCTPFQAVFGVNLIWDNFEEFVCCLGGSKEVNAHLIALNKVRNHYLQAEAEVKLDQAIRSKKPSNENYPNSIEVGELVRYFRRDGKTKDQWRGPARVVGSDGSSILINMVD